VRYTCRLQESLFPHDQQHGAAAEEPEHRHRGKPGDPAILVQKLPISGTAIPAPKYWNESITPEAKPAIFGPPMSIGAAAPTIEWVALTASEIRN